MSTFHTHATVYCRPVAGIGHAAYHKGGYPATDSNLACRTADHHTEFSGHRYVSVSCTLVSRNNKVVDNYIVI